MAVGLFDNIISQGVRKGHIPAQTEQSKKWYRDIAFGTKRVNENKLIQSDKERMTNQPKIGSMYLFRYDPKHKKTLPYYDTCPLIFPIEKAEGGFYGVNLHYITPRLRAKFMDALYETANNQKFDETTKLKLSYQILKSISKMKYYKPCLKRYLLDHTKSQFMYIYPAEWDIALMLPTARWEKRTGNRVYADSEKMIG